jgi:hypothetical protein
LYDIEESLREPDTDINKVCENIIKAIPPGWQFPDICVARITLEGEEYQSQNFEETTWKLSTDIIQHDHAVGTIDVYYLREMPAADIGPFLKEEKKLVETIADRLNHFLTYKKMKHVFQETRTANKDLAEAGKGDWETILDLVRQTDNSLFLRISNKMLNHLCWSGIDEAEALRREKKNQNIVIGKAKGDEVKGRHLRKVLDFSTEFTEKIFRIAADHLSDEKILSRIQMWLQEDKLGAVFRTMRRRLPLAEVFSNLRRYFLSTRDETYTRYPLTRGLKVLLIEYLLSNRTEYIKMAQDYVDIEDLYYLLQKVIFSTESHGKIGGKGADLFLASQIVKKAQDTTESNSPHATPKTWYISSDMMLEFIHYNNMDEVIEQKYKDIERVRLEYPHVLDMFQQRAFPSELINGLSAALDDFGNSPIIVRSSSLLEDRTGSAFISKYKSVFLGNQGTREECLSELMNAVAEIYASNFAPEPIEYRADRKLLEFSEQMGIMIQEVVGTQIGPYFLPAYSGVARSRNYFRWRPESKENGGIVHIIPGLGTRTTNRTGDEHPVTVIPHRPSDRLNGSTEDNIRLAPKRMDVINLETNSFQTIDVEELFEKFGDEHPCPELIVSAEEDGLIKPLDSDKETLKSGKGNLFVTFDGLINRSPFLLQIRNLLRTLEEKLGTPVEIEFASDGEQLYLLQCRPQTPGSTPQPVPIPEDISKDNLIFSANRYISNGYVSNITHIIYVDPEAHEALEERKHREGVVNALSELNRMLPERQFILMCAGHWSDPGNNTGGTDIKLCDFSNAAALIELSETEQALAGELSPDVHFLKDIAESGMLFLPVFPDDEKTFFNRRFLLRSKNALPELLPEYAHFADVVHVIDVPRTADGNFMQLLMNAELNRAVGLLTVPGKENTLPTERDLLEEVHPENYWHWRYHMAEQIAGQIDPEQSGVAGIYLFGSTMNGTAGPASSIDILIHFKGSNAQRETLVKWLEGWSLCLDEMNYLRTGYRSRGLLDFHIVTDEDIENKTSYAVKINAVTNAASPLKMKKAED